MFDQITAVRTFHAPAASVRELWVSPSTVVAPVTAVEMDPRVGGVIRVSTGGGPLDDLVGMFLEADPLRLTYTWHWAGSDEETLVDVQFHDVGTMTVVQVLHSGFVTEESNANHRSGWQTYFDGLAAYVEELFR